MRFFTKYFRSLFEFGDGRQVNKEYLYLFDLQYFKKFETNVKSLQKFHKNHGYNFAHGPAIPVPIQSKISIKIKKNKHPNDMNFEQIFWICHFHLPPPSIHFTAQIENMFCDIVNIHHINITIVYGIAWTQPIFQFNITQNNSHHTTP